MPKVNLNAASITKRNRNLTIPPHWEMTFLTDQGEGKVNLGNKNAQAQPRLKEILDILDNSDRKWPWLRGLTADADFEVTYNKSYMTAGVDIIHVDLTVAAHKAAMNELSSSMKRIDTRVKQSAKDNFTSKLSAYKLIWENLPGNRDFMVAGTATAKDGDTLLVTIQSVGEKLQGIPAFAIGNPIVIRMVGINTPETKKTDPAAQEDAKSRNAVIAKKYKVSEDVIFSIGAEAERAVKKILDVGNGSVIIDIDSNGESPKADPYGRWVGMVYKSVYDTSITPDPMGKDDWYINLNKTLITNESDYTFVTNKGKELPIPLADVDAPIQYTNNGTRFDSITWEKNIALNHDYAQEAIKEEEEARAEEAKKEIEKEMQKYIDTNDKTQKSQEQYVIQPGDTLASIVDKFREDGYSIPKEILIDVNNLQPNGNGGYVLIPGTDLQVPIIDMMPKNTEGTITIGNEDLKDNRNDFFPPLDDRRPMQSPYHMRIGDVQLVIPPLSIVANSASSLSKVKTLRTKSSMITKAGSSVQTLSLQLYFHDMDSINGFGVRLSNGRMYYMDGLRPLIAQFKKTPFLPIENEYINDVLDIHNVILVDLNISTVPNFPHSLAATLTLAEFDHEAYMPHVEYLDQRINYPMMRWYYQNTMRDIGSPYRTYLAPIQGRLTNDFYFRLANEADLMARQDAVKELRLMQSPLEFDSETQSGKNLLGRLQKDGELALIALGQYDRYIKLKREMGSDFPESFRNGSDAYKVIYGNTINKNTPAYFAPVEWADRPLKDNTSYIMLKVTAETTQSRLGSGLAYEVPSVPNMYKFQATGMELAQVREIGAGVKKSQMEQLAYKMSYDKVKDRANSSEAEVLMDNYHIDNLFITSMNVSYQNSFSTMQTQMGEHPTYQYLGSQDPYIQVSFETQDRQAIVLLKQLISTADYYSKKYRLGISSGFVGFENQLSNLFGVRTVMIENCVVRTVPGYPNRFQIDMSMIAFNKTQKRSESLEGFSATASKQKDDRYVTKNTQGNDPIVIERKMKDLEVYPDLELPTYKELNDALTVINAGITKYHNPSGALYVDPDFYVSTNWTYRDYFRENHDPNNKDAKIGELDIQDYTGFKGKMKVNSEKVFEADAENMALFNAMMEQIDESVNQNTKYSIDTIRPEDTPQASVVAGSDSTNPGSINTYASSSRDVSGIQEYLSSSSNYNAPPTLAEFQKWSADSNIMDMPGFTNKAVSEAAYKHWKGRNPTRVEFYKELYSLIDEFLTPYFFDERQSSSAMVKETLTYANRDSFNKAYYMWLKHSGDQRFKNIPTIATNSINYADINQTKGKFTRERLANYIKCIYNQESRWSQFIHKDNGITVPYKNKGSNAFGVGQLMVSAHAVNVEEAKRMAWDWKYNLRWSMNYLRNKLKNAFESSNPEVRTAPYDWAIRSYCVGSIHTTGKWRVVGDKYISEVMDWWNAYNSKDLKYATPSISLNKELYAYLNGSSQTTTKIIKDDKQSMIDALTDIANRNVSKNLTIRDPEAMKKMTLEELKKLYEDTMIMTGPTSQAGLDTWEDYTDQEHYKETVTALEINKLRFEESPQQVWRDMFTDLMEYDQRGRLLRAFPTFQMYIIDEGRWMTNYKIWDNLYGFNAIQSIDVHKSRKIAADTAVVKMTNVYSNLTSRRLENSYGDWSYSVWDNLIWGEPSQELLNARAEIQTGMFLQTGARIHLRMGYGSDATRLPVMFNGTITEMDTDDLVTIIAQGDGMELTNMISADPEETNDPGILSKISEPRDFLAKLLTSKGNWFKNVINNVSDGKYFKEHPLGIMHFGNPVKVPDTFATGGAVFNWHMPGADYGEAVQNIYSSNGANTFSQFTYKDGSSIGFDWSTYGFIPTWKGDEMDVEMKLYGQSTWDVAQALAYTSPDYIAAVLPFELRSTFFFGKPYYRVAYRYESNYEWSKEHQIWERTVTSEKRKPFQQFHFFNSVTDIIGNKIKASEEGVFTNCIVRPVTGKQSLLQQVDYDINYNKQKTRVIETNLCDGNGILPDFWTVEQQANFYAQSALRDSMKDMYKGTLTVIGDPSLKPHDLCHMSDIVHDMNGPFYVEDVTHSFNLEEGFVSYITPDAVAVIDDMAMVAHTSWMTSAGIGSAAFITGRYLATRAIKKIMSAKMLKIGTTWTEESLGKAMLKLTASIPHGETDVEFTKFKQGVKEYYNIKPDMQGNYTSAQLDRKALIMKDLESHVGDMKGKLKTINTTSKLKKLTHMNKKGLVAISEGIVKNLTSGRTALQFMKVGAFLGGPVSLAVNILAGLAFSFLTATWAEAYRRAKKSRQCLMILPLKYQGREFTAGINGYKGSVVGSRPGKMDQFYMGAGYGGKDDWTKSLGQTLNYFLDPGEDDIFGTGNSYGTVDYQVNTTEIASQMLPPLQE